MRYYDIFIDGAPDTFTRAPNGAIWSSHPLASDVADPGAQQIEMRLELGNYGSDSPSQNSTLIVKGVSWPQICQQTVLTDKQIIINGGMRKGLPLANFQSRSPLPGELIRGTIIKAWGNWIRDEMAVGMNISPGVAGGGDSSSSGSPGSSSSSSSSSASPGASSVDVMMRARLKSTGPRSMFRQAFATGVTGIGPSPIDTGGASALTGITQLGSLVGLDLSGIGTEIGQLFNFAGGGFPGLQAPLNLIHNLMPNMPLSSAIYQTLSTAFPQMNIIVAISSFLKLNYQDAGVYQNIYQYAAYIRKMSQSILGIQNYGGVKFYTDGRTMLARDDLTKLSITQGQIAPADLIGQPTWISKNEMHFTTVMRSDIKVGFDISLPPNILMTLGPDVNPAGSNNDASQQRTNLSFQGTFRVDKIHHVGDFRNPDGAFWSSNYECSTNLGGTSQTSVTPQASQTPTPAPVPSETTTNPIEPLPQSLRSRSVRYY